MSIEAIRPSTLVGIKRLAKSLGSERGIPHTAALDIAAQAAGFQNFRHARNVLGGSQPTAPVRRGHRLFLTAYWKDRNGGTGGRETLTLTLARPWNELIEPRHFQNHRTLTHLRAEGPDHLSRVELERTQSRARRFLCAAARVFSFIEATGLRPSKSRSRAYPGGRSSNAIPGRDHHSIWYDAESKRYVFVDEPYEMAVTSRSEERASWSGLHGFEVVQPDWPGMYAPDVGSRMYLVADKAKGVPLGPIVAALNLLPPPIVEQTWNGDSAPMLPFFVSPGAVSQAEATTQSPPPAKKPTGERNSVDYVQAFVGPQRRPKGRMPIEMHAEVGRLLKSVLIATHRRDGVYNRVNAIRSELDEWTQREYTHAEFPNEQFFDLYYHESGGTFARSLSESDRSRHVASLSQVTKILTQHYPDCPPLRSLFKRVDLAVNSLQTWR